MIFIPEKEKIVRKNRWTTDYSKLFFDHKRKFGDKLMVFGSAHSSHGFIVERFTGDLFAFGYNKHFQLGLGDIDHRYELTKNKFFSSKRVIKVCCGYHHSIFLIENSQLYATGENKNGQLGLKGISDRELPVPVDIKGVSVLDVFVGHNHTVVLSKRLKIYSFGLNDEGQLGVGDLKNRNSATEVLLPEKILSVSCGFSFSFFISFQGNIFACGINGSGELGIGQKTPAIVNTPEKLLFFKRNVLQIACGAFYSFFLTKKNQLFSTGWNFYGQLGLQDSSCLDTVDTAIPRMVSSLKNEKIISVNCGEGHSIIKSKEKFWMNGYNEYGQLGSGDLMQCSSPKLFSIEGKRIIQSLLLSHSSIHFTKNEVYGSGYNNYGELFCGKCNVRNPKTFKICNLEVKMNEKGNPRLLEETNERFEYLNSVVKEEKKLLLIFTS